LTIMLCVDEVPFDWNYHEDNLTENAFQSLFRVAKALSSRKRVIESQKKISIYFSRKKRRKRRRWKVSTNHFVIKKFTGIAICCEARLAIGLFVTLQEVKLWTSPFSTKYLLPSATDTSGVS
jgi:hypothetical protein